MDELYLDNIDEFVNDHNKIVTYKWLSLTLGVHVNTAKQMLYHYLDHKRKESSEPLHATYLVSGKLVENGLTCHKVSVVREDQLEDVKSKMSMTVSVHVYSVQKAVLKDSGPLYSVDYDAVKDNMKNCSKYSAIQCASAVPMSRAEVQQKHPTVVEPQSVKPTVNGHASLTSKPTTKSPKGIMGMFATKPATKKQEASKAIKPEPKEEAPAVDEAPKSKPAGKTNPMSNFFGNQAAKRPEKKEEKKEEEVQPASSEEPRPSASRPEVKQIDVPAPQEQTKDTKKETKDTKKEIRSSKSKTKRIQESDSEEEKMDKKRRRRIKRPVSDSSEEEEEEEEVIPDSPQPQKRREPSPCPEDDVKEESLSHANQQHSDGKRRKRRRVLKSRTFVDEDGCMVTEKGYETESYSETEEEAPSSQAPSKHPVQAKLPSSKKDDDKKKKEKKSAANASKGTKQASIMGFFQKK